ncbi:hypothetical protein [Rubrobacter calidifluminis]|uniref:hypothetical protein n=1 Tax=Rubrobacter calidifluminis TaxID=1392640 RepID=UPI00235EF98D|nr:hypothetical protein [Rubrobacter calidifluminis]
MSVTRGMHVKVLCVAVLAGLLVLGLWARGAYADSGSVTVTASNAAKFSLSLSTNSVDFGNVDPSGAPSNQQDVTAYVDGANGAYYVKSISGYAETVKVSSNAPWSGSVSAAENTGTSGMKIASGSLRWALGDISSLAQAQGATPFSTTPDTSVFNTASSCSSGATLQAGSCTYNFDYALRVLWTNAPGTFSSVVTYTVTTR